jgi:hypothetical protein
VASFTASLPKIFITFPQIQTELNDYINQGTTPTSTTLKDYIESVTILAHIDKQITLQKILHTTLSKHKHLQRRLTKQLKENHIKTTLQAIKDDPDSRFWRIVQSGATSQAAAWLRAVPDGKGMDISHQNFSNEVRNRMRIPHPYIREGLMCNCGMQTPVDRYGDHIQMCKTENKWMAAHEHCVAVMKCMAQEGSLQAQPNNVRVSLDPRDNRRGDLNVIVSGHETLVIDVQVTNACSVSDKERKPGTAAKQSEQRKNQKYAATVKAMGAHFYAFSVEVHGRYGSQATKLFNHLAHHVSLATGTRTHVVKSFWASRISCTLRNQIAEAQRFKADRLMTMDHSIAHDRADKMTQHTKYQAGGWIGDIHTPHWEEDGVYIEEI